MADRLQYISTGKTATEQLLNIQRALDHGATWIQLRWKEAPLQAYHILAEDVRKLCTAYRATYIVNDEAAMAAAVDADGVHLGLQDTAVAEARALLGPEKIIGGTANTILDVQQRRQEGCDYIGLGPFRFTTTKAKLSPILGAEGYREIIAELERTGAPYPPIYAIGGIQLADLPLLRSLGLYGVAISGLITEQPGLITTIYNTLNDTLTDTPHGQLTHRQ